MLSELAALLLCDAQIENIENDLTANSVDLRLKQRYSASAVQRIHSKYASEKDLVRSQMDGMQDKNSNEYEKLMYELNDLKDREDAEVSRQEAISTDYESFVETENAGLESRLQALRSDKETFEECLKTNVENSFNYFQ